MTGDGRDGRPRRRAIPMKSDDELMELIEAVERQELLAEDEVKRLEELVRKLHEANSMPKTMSADGPTFRPLPTEETE
jgi:hypothetical protein